LESRDILLAYFLIDHNIAARQVNFNSKLKEAQRARRTDRFDTL